MCSVGFNPPNLGEHVICERKRNVLGAIALVFAAAACDEGNSASGAGDREAGTGAPEDDGNSSEEEVGRTRRGASQACSDGVMWANTYRDLYRVQPTRDGYEIALVGPFGLEPDEEMFDIAYTPDGKLFGLSQPSSGRPSWSLKQIDVETGAATHVFSARAQETFAWALAARPNGALYLLNVAGGVFRIDPSNSETRELVTRFHEDYLTGGDIVFTDDDTMYVAVSTDGMQTYVNLLRYDFRDDKTTDLGQPAIEGGAAGTGWFSMDGLATSAGKLVGFGDLVTTVDLASHEGTAIYLEPGMRSFVGATAAHCK